MGSRLHLMEPLPKFSLHAVKWRTWVNTSVTARTTKEKTAQKEKSPLNLLPRLRLQKRKRLSLSQRPCQSEKRPTKNCKKKKKLEKLHLLPRKRKNRKEICCIQT